MESTQSADMLSVPVSDSDSDSNFHPDANSIEVLEQVDKQVSELADQLSSEAGATVDTCQIFDASPVDNDLNDSSDNSEINDVSEISEAVNTASADTTPGASTAKTQSAPRGMVEADDRVSKKDLVALLEGFVKIIKTDDVQPAGTGMTTVQANQMVLSEGRGEAHIDDRTVEIDQLRGLVIEAQDTIIKLLTDRVEDRSRIATLEAQLSLLPDLQAQADRAMSVAVRTEEYRGELNKMKFELDRFRLFRVRQEAEMKKSTIFNRIQKWLFSRPNAPDETLQNKN